MDNLQVAIEMKHRHKKISLSNLITCIVIEDTKWRKCQTSRKLYVLEKNLMQNNLTHKRNKTLS